MEYLYLFMSLIGHCMVYAVAILLGMIVDNIVMMSRFNRRRQEHSSRLIRATLNNSYFFFAVFDIWDIEII